MKKGFTILEMILVLTVVSIIVLITVPNIAQKKRIINNKGCQALLEIINSQILLYDLETGEMPGDVDDLIAEGYTPTDAQELTSKQTGIPFKEIYNEYWRFAMNCRNFKKRKGKKSGEAMYQMAV